jgi:subfamily B ATP-binding cassette protein MsbA
MMASFILFVFLTKGVCEYFGNYLVNVVGFSAVTDVRQSIFEKLLRQDAEFYSLHSTGRLMSSIMNDIEKIQVAISHMLADWLRQTFLALGLLFVVLQTDWRLALVSPHAVAVRADSLPPASASASAATRAAPRMTPPNSIRSCRRRSAAILW